MKGAHSYPTPVNATDVPYVVCTTCHNQHVMNIYAASATSPIAGSATGTYATYFFVNGPYNVNTSAVNTDARRTAPPSSAASATLASRTKPTAARCRPRSKLGYFDSGGERNPLLRF